MEGVINKMLKEKMLWSISTVIISQQVEVGIYRMHVACGVTATALDIDTHIMVGIHVCALDRTRRTCVYDRRPSPVRGNDIANQARKPHLRENPCKLR